MPQTSATPVRRRLWALVAATLVALGVMVATASPAHAHDELIGSDPAPGSTMESLPGQLTLTFSAGIADDEGASVVQVTDAAGTSLAAGTPTVRDNVLTQPLQGAASGAVTVLWKAVSSDGHPISGELSFTVAGAASPSATPEPAQPAPTPTATPTPIDEDPDMTVDPAATLFANLLPWLIAAVVAAVVIALVVSSRRRRGGPSGPGSEPPGDQ